MSTLNRAIAIAAEAHAGQTDKGGLPYILHPLRVMMRMKTEDEMIVAVLHDLIENCYDWSFYRLLGEEEFSFLRASAIDILTRRKGQKYETYIQQISRDPLATSVKLADLADNLDPARPSTAMLPAATIAKYEWARTVLNGGECGSNR